ncbi:MAG TPA: hypothetical protein VNQ53_15580 [Nocardioides sp.]|nr:hypothetical protein [Nocardioides sp.]
MANVHPSPSLDRRSIVVAVDDRSRFTGVEVSTLDDGLRETAALSAAFDDAYGRAIVDAAVPASAATGASRGTRTPAGPVLRGRPAGPTPHDEPRWDLINAGYGSGSDTLSLSPTGASDNECVYVRLDPASSRGRLVDIDQEWLRQTTTTRLEAAIGQAFADAYRKRDLS